MVPDRLEVFDEVVSDACDELKDMAFSSNIERLHHLESAVSAFASIGVLLEARSIVHELLDDDTGPEEETHA